MPSATTTFSSVSGRKTEYPAQNPCVGLRATLARSATHGAAGVFETAAKSEDTFDREPTAQDLGEIEEAIQTIEANNKNHMDSDDPIMSMYLKNISQFPLLTREQETDLANRIKNGDKAAQNKLLEGNLRLIVKIAKEYTGLGISLPDLIQEGNIGAFKAAKKYDPDRGAKFGTYAAWYIRQGIMRSLSNSGRTIRVPIHMVENVTRLQKERSKLTYELGREPTRGELSEHLQIDEKAVIKIQMAETITKQVLSLNVPGNDDSPNTWESQIPDEKAADPCVEADGGTDVDHTEFLLSPLDPRERKVIIARFGLDGKKEKTLDEVGKEFKVTRERVRQIQAEALKKIRRALEWEEAYGKVDNDTGTSIRKELLLRL